jgi:hypothetical protein
MDIDTDKLGDAALAILSISLHDGRRVWKNLDWAIADRLYEKGIIDDPENKTKSRVADRCGHRARAQGNG